LNKEHYGLRKLKSASGIFGGAKLVKNPRIDPVLCRASAGQDFVGDVDWACDGTQFVRVSLGGVRDEAEIRDPAYLIGALPGQIIQMMKKAGAVNPIFVLDEVDRCPRIFRGGSIGRR